MAEELQGLLDRIQNEGFKKIEEEKRKVLSDAQKQASDIVAEAKKEAEDLMKKAKSDAEVEKQRAEAAIRQSARDIIIKLNEEMLLRVRNIVKDSISQAMTAGLMAEIIRKTVSAYIAEKDNREEPNLEIMLSQKDLDSLGEKLHASLVNDLKIKPKIALGGDFAAGLQIGFKGSDVFLDFSDEAVADLICSYAGPKLAAIINKKQKQ